MSKNLKNLVPKEHTIIRSEYVSTNWHYYQGQCDDSEMFPHEEYGEPKDGFDYMEDFANDEYFSVLDMLAAADILKQVKAGKQLELHRVMHFTDSHAGTLKKIMACKWLDEDDLLELPRYAFRQYAVLENPKISGILFTYLFNQGLDSDEIKDEILELDELEDDEDALENFEEFLCSVEESVGA